MRVLLIEDDEDDYFVMKKWLAEVSSQVFELAWVTDYNKGLEAINSSRYDICFLDYRLGGHDGVELLRSVNGRESVPPIVLLTSHGDYLVDLEAMKAGAADYLDKSHLNAPLLERTIRYALERRRAEEALRRSEGQLKLLSARLITAQEEERKRISRELHDSIGSFLAVIKSSLEEFRKECPVPNPLENLISMTQRATDETRRIMTALRPSILDDLGLSAAIAWFCREYQIIYPSIRVETAFEIDESEIPEDLKTPIFRIVQEAFNNIAKHSKAERANLVVRHSNGMLELLIEDDGSGFIPDDVVLSHGDGRGIGLSSMRERADLSGGALSIKTAPGKGTTICASWPRG